MYEKVNRYTNEQMSLSSSGYMYFRSPLGRYPTFHNLLSVGGRKSASSVLKNFSYFFEQVSGILL